MLRVSIAEPAAKEVGDEEEASGNSEKGLYVGMQAVGTKAD